MKRLPILLIVLSLLPASLCGCTKPADTSGDSLSTPDPSANSDDSSASSQESESMWLLREMMALDYHAMTVADSNQKIQDIAAAADLSIFEAISNIYDGGEIQDASGDI